MENIVRKIARNHFEGIPSAINRFGTGTGNYVFFVALGKESYVFRLSENPYDETVYWLRELRKRGIPVQEVLASGIWDGYHYLILSYLPGKELNDCYRELSSTDKQNIAHEVIQIQKRAATLDARMTQPWTEWVREMLDRARTRITENGYFDTNKVDMVIAFSREFAPYFQSLTPVSYLDDITTKNLLIKNGHVSGVIDVDWMGYGDPLTFAALTYMALRAMDCDTEYVDFLLKEMKTTDEQKHVFWFYVLLYCVDFMGERGCTFNGKTVAINSEIIAQLNQLFDELITELS